MTMKVFTFLLLVLSFFNARSQDSSVVIHGFVLSGNEKTIPKIIYREVLFKANDTLSSQDLKEKIVQSQKNLINTGLFNFATITAVPINKTEVAIQIVVEERWFIWPSPIFELAETNFNTWWLTKDFSRTNYGAFINWKNFRGRNDNFYLKLRFGYNQEFRVSYRFPYFNKKQSIGMGVSFDYFQQKEIAIGTFENKRTFINTGDDNMRQEYQYKLQGFYRKNIFTEHLVEIRLTNTIVNDTVSRLNPQYLLNSSNRIDFLSFIYSVRKDHRDIKAYPLQGYLAEAIFQKNGFGLFDNGLNQLAYFTGRFKKFIPLSARWYSGASYTQKVSLYQKEPYYTQRGLGYSDFVRGYEYYVIDAQQYSLVKTNVKYQLVKPRVKTLNFVKIKQFNKVPYSIYTSIFFDAAYASDKLYDQQNQLANKWLTGIGVGIDFVTYYDKVVRVEFSRNHLNETGIFIHFKQPL
jgi:hypothetical protein